MVAHLLAPLWFLPLPLVCESMMEITGYTLEHALEEPVTT
jgi:hypothetical protein